MTFEQFTSRYVPCANGDDYKGSDGFCRFNSSCSGISEGIIPPCCNYFGSYSRWREHVGIDFGAGVTQIRIAFCEKCNGVFKNECATCGIHESIAKADPLS